MKEKIKNATIIYNPISTGFKESSINLIAKTLKENNITPNFEKSMYAGHIIDLIKDYDDKNNLIITLGGDGTVSEAYKAFNQINQKGLYSHVPTGTTNDMAKNYNVNEKKINKIVEDIINGDISYLDSFDVSGIIAAYTCTFGFLSHIPYITKPILKRKLGNAGYVTTALPEIIKKPEIYKIIYEADNKENVTDCIFGSISNSKGFANIDLYPNAKLDDNKLEYMFFKKLKPHIIAELFIKYLKNEIDLSQYPEIVTFGQAENIKLKFIDSYPTYAFDIDGENSNILPTKDNNEVIIKPAKKIKVLKNKG